jgi:KUP system potassium uptake protein
MSTAPPSSARPRAPRLAAASLAALGVVYGDIGTSPLYAIRECFSPRGAGVPPDPANVIGVLSLVLWSLVVVVLVKYVLFVMRADNRGEGGILALVTLVAPAGELPRARRWLLPLGLFGAALLYGDGAITPAISVLSAIEGLEVVEPGLADWVLPLSCAVLIGLFLLQRLGTDRVGRLFGPVMLVWFSTLALLGVHSLVQSPEVLAALSPLQAAAFLLKHGSFGFAVLAAVFLVVTGAETLYADLGHFGARPIRAAWFAVVLPALALNYVGQGALLVRDPSALENPFYRLAPDWLLPPLIGLATLATVIASQAVISGAFSLSRQAQMLGYLPRMEVVHSSARQMGQVFVPVVNRLLLAGTVLLAVGFGSSSSLAGAYGVAVSATMVVTTVLACIAARRRWHWPLPGVLAIGAAFLTVDLAFLGANLGKVGQGGWVPLVVAAAIFTVMATWRRGRAVLRQRLSSARVDERAFVADLEAHPPLRVPGTAVFLDSQTDGIPRTLLHNLKHNKVLHERVVLLHFTLEEVPRVPDAQRFRFQELGGGLLRLEVRRGFLEGVDVPALLEEAKSYGIDLDLAAPTFFLGRETLVAVPGGGLSGWRKGLFAFLARNAESAARHFGIPPGRVVELGAQVEL